MNQEDQDWPKNYFNYFTEVEEHFQKARGTGLFLLSPLDWSLIESWKNAGVPLDAVLRGIDVAFTHWRSRKNKQQSVNSVAYCAQAIAKEAQIMADAGMGKRTEAVAPPFSIEELRSYLEKSAADLRARDFPVTQELAGSLEKLAADAELHYTDLEQLEQRLTAMEDKLTAAAKTLLTEEQLFEARRKLDLDLRPYRGKMSAEQLAMLERQYLDRNALESAKLPRLSLFYMR